MLPKTISGMILSLAVLLSQTAWAQLPKSAVIGTNTPGTVFYALAGGLAKVASEAGPVQTTVQPYTGTSTFLPLLDNGETSDRERSRHGNGLSRPAKAQDRRQERVFALSQYPLGHARCSLIIGLLVKKDSPLKSVRHQGSG